MNLKWIAASVLALVVASGLSGCGGTVGLGSEGSAPTHSAFVGEWTGTWTRSDGSHGTLTMNIGLNGTQYGVMTNANTAYSPALWLAATNAQGALSGNYQFAPVFTSPPGTTSAEPRHVFGGNAGSVSINATGHLVGKFGDIADLSSTVGSMSIDLAGIPVPTSVSPFAGVWSGSNTPVPYGTTPIEILVFNSGFINGAIASGESSIPIFGEVDSNGFFDIVVWDPTFPYDLRGQFTKAKGELTAPYCMYFGEGPVATYNNGSAVVGSITTTPGAPSAAESQLRRPNL